MKTHPHITVRDLPHSTAIETQVLKKIDKLEQFYQQITRCDVVIEQNQKHNHQGKLYQVRITLSVPQKKLTVNHGQAEDVYVAIRDAFIAARRQLLNYVRQRRGTIKTHAMRLHGRIVRIFPRDRYGFIAENGNEFYFSDANLTNGDFDKLTVGCSVAFIESIAPGGQPQANRVTLYHEREH